MSFQEDIEQRVHEIRKRRYPRGYRKRSRNSPEARERQRSAGTWKPGDELKDQGVVPPQAPESREELRHDNV